MNVLWTNLQGRIDNINPLAIENQTASLDQCKKRCVGLTRKWQKNDPRNKESHLPIHHATYGAIINRSGQPYVSKADTPVRYAWNEDL